MSDEQKRYKKLENRRIAQVQLANADTWGDYRTLLIRFTDGGTARIESESDGEGGSSLEIEVDGYS